MNVRITTMFIFIIISTKNVYSSPPKVKTHFFKWGGTQNGHFDEPVIPMNFIQILGNLQNQANKNSRWLPHEEKKNGILRSSQIQYKGNTQQAGFTFQGGQQKHPTRLRGSPKLVYPVLQHRNYHQANRFVTSFPNLIKLQTVPNFPTAGKVLKVNGDENKSGTGYSRVIVGNQKSSDSLIHTNFNGNWNSRLNPSIGNKNPQLRIPLQRFKPIRKSNVNRNFRPRFTTAPINVNPQNFRYRNSPLNRNPTSQSYTFRNDLNRNNPSHVLGYSGSSQTSAGQFGSYSKNIEKSAFQRLPSQKVFLNDQILNGSFFFLPKHPNYAFSYKPNEVFRPQRPISITEEYAGNFNDRHYWFPYPLFNTVIDLDRSNPNSGSNDKLESNDNVQVFKDFHAISNVDELSDHEVGNKNYVLSLNNPRIPGFQYNSKRNNTSGQPEWLNYFMDSNAENGHEILIGFVHESDLSKTNIVKNDREFFQHRNASNGHDVINGQNNVPMTYDSETESSTTPPIDNFENASDVSETDSFNLPLSSTSSNMDKSNFTNTTSKLPDISITNILNLEVHLGNHSLVWKQNNTKKPILNKDVETLRNYKVTKQILENETIVNKREILNMPEDQFSDNGLNIKLYLSLTSKDTDVSDVIKLQNEDQEKLLMIRQTVPVNENNKIGKPVNNIIKDSLNEDAGNEENHRDANMFIISDNAENTSISEDLTHHEKIIN